MFKKLLISLIYSNLVVTTSLNSNHRMHNLYANFVRILGVCKRFPQDLVNDKELAEGKRRERVSSEVSKSSVVLKNALKNVNYLLDW